MQTNSEAFVRPTLVIALLLSLAACTGGPQQPSDTVDDRSTEALRGDPGDDPTTPEADAAGSAPGTDAPATSDTSALDPAALTTPDLSPITGQWAYSAEECGTEAAPALTITETRYESADRQCDIVSTIDRGDGGVTATLSCSNPVTGAMTAELLTIVPGDGDTLAVSVVGSETAAQTYARCR